MSNRPVVLVVEDDVLVRVVTTEILEENGYAPLVASSADEGLVTLVNRPEVEVVVTDVILPGTLDGLGFVSEIRKRWPHKAVVVTSGRAPEMAAANAPNTVFLQKPFDQKALVAALSQAQTV
ncbi:response regulator [Pseudomonas sp.]|uniref:response regulator n=1 Tax=Pseudomonas sp. TaxID=306 RepID=UPI0025E2205C|nr:response regulator [Pseudomonas sp.]